MGDGGGSMKGKVVVMEPTGADTQVLCRIGHSDIIVVSHDRIAAHAGDDISLQPDLDARPHLRRTNGAKACAAERCAPASAMRESVEWTALPPAAASRIVLRP